MNNSYEKQISRRFALEWKIYKMIVPYYESHLLKWVTPFKQADFSGKDVLDVGCGMGRNPYFFLKWGVKNVVGVDVDDEIVQSARYNLRGFKNCNIEQKSVYGLDYSNKFDLVTCLGVLHHLHDSSLALKKLLNAAKPGGKVLLWVYGYEGNELLLRILNPIRKFCKSIDSRIIATIALAPTLILQILLKSFDIKHPYYSFISRYSFRQLHLIVHDQLVPSISNYYKRSDLERLVRVNCSHKFDIYRVNNISYSVLITKE
ncbi:MAG: class I SAM-dependent methyltransferase [Planctomycetes bacterium]|nr:class I SAM-dependent methyltransferase [Planctomycetota bacterium]